MTLHSYSARIDFLLQLAARLHAYGTTAQRLEAAISAVALQLDLRCNAWVNPTGIILSCADARAESGDGAPETTQVIRLEPGDVHLAKLCAADAIAEEVLAGRMGLIEGSAALRALDRPEPRRSQVMTAFSFGLASASIAGLLRSGWADIGTAACIGWIIGTLYVLGAKRPRLSEGLDAIAALLATLLATLVAYYFVPLTVKTVVLASLIVLLPGLTLTNAVSELSSQHLISGTARFAGAVATLLKLTFGTVAATQLARLVDWVPVDPVPSLPPFWLEWVALAIAAYAFAVLFRAHRRDFLLVMGSALLGYLSSRYAGATLGNEAGVFVAGLVVSAVSNIYAQCWNRPGALVRVPGVILLVPGSVGFRSLSFVFERDVFLGLDTGFTLITLLISLVAGLLFGNLLVPPRRSL